MSDDFRKCLVSFSLWIVIGFSIYVYIESKKTLEKPEYLAEPNTQVKFIDSEASVFQVFGSKGTNNLDVPEWFNGLSEERKRGFILFVRSAALQSLLGKKISFTDEEWSAHISKIEELTKDFLLKSDPVEITQRYTALYTQAEKQRSLFLERNQWLRYYLGEKYADFEKGLFYFFAEHSHGDDEVLAKAGQFSSQRVKMVLISKAILKSRENKARISPRPEVSDKQIREIVAASFFTELFYGIPSDFMLLINAYETNFSMEFWEGGSGTSQQTTRAANMVLFSDYWIDKVREASGEKIRLQMVSISALDNVFLCVTEAAKTIAIKAAELGIGTDEISPAKNVHFAGQIRSAIWATAYKYNGSKKYAQSYADDVNLFYAKREFWLKECSDVKDLYVENK